MAGFPAILKIYVSAYIILSEIYVYCKYVYIQYTVPCAYSIIYRTVYIQYTIHIVYSMLYTEYAHKNQVDENKIKICKHQNKHILNRR